MPLSKELQALYDKAIQERDEILKKTKPLRIEEEKVLAKLEPVKKELRDIREKKAKIEKDGNLVEVTRTIVALGKTANPGKSLKAEPGKFENKPS